jgi:RNA polymerase sigma-70 factor (ECF subfamily)
VLAGCKQAWQTWYEESFPGLAAYVSWRCAGLRDLADEIVQETWLTAVRRIRDFDPGQGSFAGWLRGIAANCLRKHFSRSHRQFQPLDGQPEPATVDSDLEKRDEAARIAWTLAQLPPRYEAVLRAKYLEQQSVERIAAEWKETAKAVESLLTRARQAFREVFDRPERADSPIREDKP